MITDESLNKFDDIYTNAPKDKNNRAISSALKRAFNQEEEEPMTKWDTVDDISENTVCVPNFDSAEFNAKFEPLKKALVALDELQCEFLEYIRCKLWTAGKEEKDWLDLFHTTTPFKIRSTSVSRNFKEFEEYCKSISFSDYILTMMRTSIISAYGFDPEEAEEDE